jgi:DNA-binding GntR family transcriptional regulator
VGASPRGTYARVAEELERRIGDGLYVQGLPSEQGLCREFGVARSTVRRALAVLVARDRIRADPGVGWKVTGGGAAATHQAVVDGVAGRVLSGELVSGDRLPSEAELSAAYGIPRVAVRRALRLLRADGVVYARQGIGWFVA